MRPNDWLIVGGHRVGPIKADSSFDQLVEVFGADHVRMQKVGVGEGEMASAFVIYPGTDNEVHAILDEEGQVRMIRIEGVHTKWRTASGISLGSSLASVEKANGKPFVVSGFEWDYPGTVESWEDGHFHERLGIAFDYRHRYEYEEMMQRPNLRWNGASDGKEMKSLGLYVDRIFTHLK